MRHIALDIEVNNLEEVQAELDHISVLISEGFTSGGGWSIEGEDEPVEKDTEIEREVVELEKKSTLFPGE